MPEASIGIFVVLCEAAATGARVNIYADDTYLHAVCPV
jgi:hypothetical protein